MRPDLVTNKQWFKYSYHFIAEPFIGLKRSERAKRKKLNNLYWEIIKNEDVSSHGETFDVKGIEQSSFDPFINNKKEFLNSPYVFRGFAKNWLCVQKWSKDFLKEHYAITEIALMDNPGLVGKDKESEYREINPADFSDYQY